MGPTAGPPDRACDVNALNKKKRIVSTMRLFFDEARLWD
jgi:hypothetical protein